MLHMTVDLTVNHFFEIVANNWSSAPGAKSPILDQAKKYLNIMFEKHIGIIGQIRILAFLVSLLELHLSLLL